MHHFFISTEYIANGRVEIVGQLVHQFKNVLRFRVGDTVIVFDNTGMEYVVKLNSFLDNKIIGIVLDSYKNKNEPVVNIRIFQSLIRFDKFELVLQKCTELGVSAFVPIISEKSTMYRSLNSVKKKYDRWNRIIIESTEQSQRGLLPSLYDPCNFKEACSFVNDFALIGSLNCNENIKDTLEIVPNSNVSVDIFIGPEYGFTVEEEFFAIKNGIRKLSLGPRILRAETAAISAMAIVLYELQNKDLDY